MSQQIEDRLRSALRAEAEGLRLSSDPWQENQRRVSAAASGRSRRVLTVAAVALAVATLTGGIALLGGRGPGGAPASGTGDSFSTENLLGPPVEAETLTIDGQQTVHTIALSDMTGKGPNLCDQYEQVVAQGAGSSNSSSGSGGCTTRDPAADDDAVAFDWLTGTEGSGDIRGVTAGVDSRVSTVQIWMDNGDMVLATLHPTGWDDTKMFALTTQPPDAPTAQRLVAYGHDGSVLQAVDLAERLGDEWVPAISACATDSRAASLLPEQGSRPNASVFLGSSDVRVTIRAASGDSGGVCIPALRSRPIAGWHGYRPLVVALLGPEVESVGILVDGESRQQLEPTVVADTLWRVAIFTGLTLEDISSSELIAVDGEGTQLDRQSVARPVNP